MAVIDIGSPYSTFIRFNIEGIAHGNVPNPNWSKVQSLRTGGYEDRIGGGALVVNLTLEYRQAPQFYTNLLTALNQSTDGRVRAQVQWGYSTTSGVAAPVSPLYEMIIVKCTPTDLWKTLEVQLIQDDANDKYLTWKPETKQMLEERTKSDPFYDLSDLVTAIAQYQGWEVGKIVPTKSQYKIHEEQYPEYAEPPVIKIRSFYLTPLQAIAELLTRYANESLVGETGYVSTVKYTPEHPYGLYYFVPTINLKSNYGVTNKTYQYVIQGTSNGTVLEFTPKFYGNMYVDEANPQIKALLNSDEKDRIYQSLTDQVNRLRETPSKLEVTTLDSMEFLEYSPNIGSKKPTENDNIAKPVSFAQYVQVPRSKTIAQNLSEVDQFARNLMENDIKRYLNVLSIRTTAEMVIVGDPELNAMDYINVIVMYPTNWEASLATRIHPSSGVYQIAKIVHEINNGTYQTRLTLIAQDSDKETFKVDSMAALSSGRIVTEEELKALEESAKSAEAAAQSQDSTKESERISQIIEMAASQIGVKESPKDSNNVKYNTDYYGHEVSGSEYPWCCVFVWWVFKECNLSASFYGGEKTAYCPDVETYYKNKGRWYTSGQPGDLILFDFSGKGVANHIGIVEKVNSDGSYVTIEGNTSNESDDNGGAVKRRTRSSSIRGFARPEY